MQRNCNFLEMERWRLHSNTVVQYEHWDKVLLGMNVVSCEVTDEHEKILETLDSTLAYTENSSHIRLHPWVDVYRPRSLFLKHT